MSASHIEQFRLPDLGEGLPEGEILRWLVEVGETVTLNQPIVEVETAKAAVEIPAKWAGRVVEIFHGAGEVVAVGTPIVAIETEPGTGAVLATPAGGHGRVTIADGGRDAVSDRGVAQDGERTPVLVGYGPRTNGGRTSGRVRHGQVARDLPRDVPVESARRDLPTAGSAAQPTMTSTGGSAAQPTMTSTAGSAAQPAMTSTAADGPRAQPTGPVLAKPPVRKLARDLGVELCDVVGTGPQGSITREDVLTWNTVRARNAPAGQTGIGLTVPGTGAHETGGQGTGVHQTGAQGTSAHGTGVRGAAGHEPVERRVPVRGVRRLAAENLVASAFSAPHVTEFLTVDVTRSLRVLDRLRLNQQWQGVRMSPLLIAAKAALAAIRRHPMVNSSWAGEEIVVHGSVNLGIAVAAERGLLVPNIKRADLLSTRDLAEAMGAMVDTTRAGRASPADLTGGTFTITNIGVFGIDAGTPILPPGEAAILALGAIREAPWVHKGKVKVRKVLTLGLSFDHRIIDGELGSRFLRDVGDFLEDPEVHLLAWG